MDNRRFHQDRRGIAKFYKAVVEGADSNEGRVSVDEGIFTNAFNGTPILTAQRNMTWSIPLRDRRVNFGNGQLVSDITTTADLVTVWSLRVSGRCWEWLGVWNCPETFFFENFLPILQDVLLSQYNQTWKFPLPTVNFIAYYII